MIFYCFLVCQTAAACCRRLIAAAHSVFSRLFQSKQESERRSGWRGSGRTAAKIVQTEYYQVYLTEVSDLAKAGWKPNGAHSPGQAKRHPGYHVL